MTSTSIALCGDILPTRRLVPPPRSAERVYALIRSADLSVGNFEMPLSDRGAPIQKLLNVRADPAIAADVPALGVRIVTLANNHAVDCGLEGLADTRDGLAAAGIDVVGFGGSRNDAAACAVKEVGGLRVGVIAFSCLTPTGMSAGDDRAGISPIHVVTAYEIDPWYQMEEPGDPSVVTVRTSVRPDDLSWATRRVAEAKARCDFLIVTIHWGFGSGETIADYQPPLARALIDAGADVIHGHHPHAIHGIGFHAGKPIFYSLGTLVGQQVFLEASEQVKTLWAGMSRDGYLVRLDCADGRLAAIHLTPTTMDADRLPVVAEGDAFDAIAARLQRLSAPLGALVRPADPAGLEVRPAH